MKKNLIPLTKEEAIDLMVAGETLENGIDNFDVASYKWSGGVVKYDLYYHDSAEPVEEIPQLYLRGSYIRTPEEYLEKYKDNKKICKAIIFATNKHEGQMRKGTKIPYISHPLEVLQILDNESELIQIAGILHDTLEDTDTTEEEIKNLFGVKTLKIIKELSEDKNKSWKERKQHTIDNLPNASYEAKAVCCADKLANLRTMLPDKYKYRKKFWKRFNASKDEIAWYYKGVINALDGSDKDKFKTAMYYSLKEQYKKVFEI